MTRSAIEVRAARPYPVVVGPGALAEAAGTAHGASAVAVLSDAHVAPLHAARLGPLAAAPTHVVAPGEGAKSFAVLEQVLDFLAAADLDRHSVLVALGGGVVGDLGGLAASLYMRGIDVVQCPTTLLAMVDAAVGGKTAVNLAAGKNLAGTFHAPRAVFADPTVLATLPPEEYLSGLGEVVKTALVGDAALLALLEARSAAVGRREPALLGEVVERCVRVKAGVVGRDEKEDGERKTLNLGHTFAHGIERAAGYGAIPHGVAVAAGLGLALRASARLGRLADAALPARVAALLARLGLPPDLAALRRRYGCALPPAALLAGMRHDKKGRAGAPALVVPCAAGVVEWDIPADPVLLESLLDGG
ncbi:MAG: 3-dehydroquinate synthase [Planctomycetota bacterium]